MQTLHGCIETGYHRFTFQKQGMKVDFHNGHHCIFNHVHFRLYKSSRVIFCSRNIKQMRRNGNNCGMVKGEVIVVYISMPTSQLVCLDIAIGLFIFKQLFTHKYQIVNRLH